MGKKGAKRIKKKRPNDRIRLEHNSFGKVRKMEAGYEWGDRNRREGEYLYVRVRVLMYVRARARARVCVCVCVCVCAEASGR